MARARDWITAARPLAQANIAVPLLFGQAVAWATERTFDARWLAYLAVLGVVDQLFIVFANDYADRHADGAERTPFSGGSGVLQSGRIAPAALGRAAIAMGAALVALGLAAAPVRPFLPVLACAAIALLHAYSFPPLRLSYRGGGAWLQAMGVGGVLPLAGFYAQSGGLDLPAWALVPSFVAGLGGNLLTALPDVEQDARSGKRTFAVAYGESRAILACTALLAAATLAASAAPLPLPPIVATAALASLACACAVGLGMRDRRRARLAFVILAGGAQHATLAGWAIALAAR